jgi:hypothetical protein
LGDIRCKTGEAGALKAGEKGTLGDIKPGEAVAADLGDIKPGEAAAADLGRTAAVLGDLGDLKMGTAAAADLGDIKPGEAAAAADLGDDIKLGTSSLSTSRNPSLPNTPCCGPLNGLPSNGSLSISCLYVFYCYIIYFIKKC